MNTFVLVALAALLALLFFCVKKYQTLISYYSLIEGSFVEGEAYVTVFPKRNVIPFKIWVNLRQFRQLILTFFTLRFLDLFQQSAKEVKIESLDGKTHLCRIGNNEILVVFTRTTDIPRKYTAHGSLTAKISDSLAETNLRTFSVNVNPRKLAIANGMAIVYCEDFNHEGEGGILQIYAGSNVYLDFERMYYKPPKKSKAA